MCWMRWRTSVGRKSKGGEIGTSATGTKVCELEADAEMGRRTVRRRRTGGVRKC